MADFDAIWKAGPWRKQGKIQARRRYEKLSQKDRALIETAAEEYAAYCESNPRYTPMWGSTFFGEQKGWREWLPENRETEAIRDVEDSDSFAPHSHFCRICETPHEWECDLFQLGCALFYHAACREYFRGRKHV